MRILYLQYKYNRTVQEILTVPVPERICNEKKRMEDKMKHYEMTSITYFRTEFSASSNFDRDLYKILRAKAVEK